MTMEDTAEQKRKTLDSKLEGSNLGSESTSQKLKEISGLVRENNKTLLKLERSRKNRLRIRVVIFLLVAVYIVSMVYFVKQKLPSLLESYLPTGGLTEILFNLYTPKETDLNDTQPLNAPLPIVGTVSELFSEGESSVSPDFFEDVLKELEEKGIRFENQDLNAEIDLNTALEILNTSGVLERN